MAITGCCLLGVMFYGLVLEAGVATGNSAVHTLVYSDIGSSSYDKCIRVLNGTKQIGCQSELNGNVGVLFLINKSSDIDKVNTGAYGPYIILLHADILSVVTLKRLQDTKKVTGIIVYAEHGYSGKPTGWSPEPQCPRFVYGLYSDRYGPQYSHCEDNPWNTVGNGLSTYDTEFPIFQMKNITATRQILSCYNKNNLDGEYPFCAAQMNARMDAAVSTETCIRRNNLQNNLSPASYCSPMGGQNIICMLQSSPTPDRRPVILLTAALDSRSFLLESIAPGANSATGFITLLSVAKFLGNLTDNEKNTMTHRVMFAFFDGEAFDNTGSTRMVYDMTENKFPFASDSNKQQPERINLTDVKYIIELGQLGHVRDQVWIHSDPVSNLGTNIKEILQQQSSGSSVDFSIPSDVIGLPPSSLQSVLKKRNISGVLITDFNRNYMNKHYFSTYDTPDKLGIKYNSTQTEDQTIAELYPLANKLGEISHVISRTVYNLATGKNLSSPAFDASDIANTLYCYLFNWSCTFLREYVDSNIANKFSPSSYPIDRYVSVYQSGKVSQSTYMARNLLVWYTGGRVNSSDSEECKAPDNNVIYEYLSFKRNSSNICVKAPVYLTDGRSPSTVISNYDFVNGEYPSWSESLWERDAFRLSIFLVQDPVSQGMVLMSGLLILIFSLLLVMLVSRKSDILFNTGNVL